jgi:hypothetical protein
MIIGLRAVDSGEPRVKHQETNKKNIDTVSIEISTLPLFLFQGSAIRSSAISQSAEHVPADNVLERSEAMSIVISSPPDCLRYAFLLLEMPISAGNLRLIKPRRSVVKV